MRTLSFLLIFVISNVFTALSQTLYTDGARLTADSITYAVETKFNVFFSLVNTQNTLCHQQPIDLNGNVVPPEALEYELGELDAESLRQAITATFNQEELAILGATKSGVRLILTKNNLGELLEVEFAVYINPVSLTIPIYKFELFEKNLKEYIRFYLSDFEKNLQFSHSSILIRWERYAPNMLIDKNPDAEMLPDSLQINP